MKFLPVPLRISLCIAGLIMAYGYYNYSRVAAYSEDLVKTTTTVVNVEERTSSSLHKHSYTHTFIAYVKFNIGDKEINTKIEGVSSDTKVGDTITAYYDPATPQSLVTQSGKDITLYIFEGTGVIIILIGIFFSIKDPITEHINRKKQESC